MSSIDDKLESLIMYLRGYRQILKAPNTAGLDSRDELEAKIKPLVVDLMGYGAALREKEEEESGKIDARLTQLLNARIDTRAKEEEYKAIVEEVAGIKRVVRALPKINPGEREIKSNLRLLDKNVQNIERAVKDLSRKPVNVNLVESETMKEINLLRKQLVSPEGGSDNIYISYPATGEKKSVGVGTFVIDFLTGEVTLADGTTERASNRLENTDFSEVKSLSIEVNKAVVITLDSGGKYPIGANQLFSIERQKFRTAYIAISETTNVTIWASTDEEGAIRIDKPTTIDTDERRYTRLIVYSGDNPEYVGEALPGSSEDDPVWRIQYIEYSGSNPTSVKWAEGTEKFINTWSARSSYTYS